jgi:D-methionine transport system ATP-binding protein
MIRITGLTKSFGDEVVLKDVTFDVHEGDVFGVVGHSGAGKSTLLRCLNGLENFDIGHVEVMGKSLGGMTQPGFRELRREMGMIFQNFNLMNRKNVFENISFPLEVWKTPRTRIRERVNELLDVVGLSEKREEKIRNLSGGQKQRVGIARALALNPRILLCDEATSALDPKTTDSILDLLSDINRRFNLTVILVTHQMEAVKRICNKVVLLDQGEVKGYGPTDALFLAPTPELGKLVREEYESLSNGINIRLSFPREIAKDCVITSMARELDTNFSVVGGRLERFRESVMGFLIINIEAPDFERITAYLDRNRIFWEVLENVE